MFKRFINHIAKRYRYWRYRRLLRKLYRKYSKKFDDFYVVRKQISGEFYWRTGIPVPKNEIYQYFWYR